MLNFFIYYYLSMAFLGFSLLDRTEFPRFRCRRRGIDKLIHT